MRIMCKLNDRSVIGLLLVFFVFFMADPASCNTVYSLDKETVFCVYFRMSGEVIDELDLEDLCFSLGRPTFSAYKPSEMFIKNTLRRAKALVIKKMGSYGENPTFKWRFNYSPSYNSQKPASSILIQDLPQPTPFIKPEISKRGQMSLNRLLSFLTHKRVKLGKSLRVFKGINRNKKSAFSINVYLKPGNIEYRFQKRNIAQEDVLLPLRCIVFYPVKMEVFPLERPGDMLLCYTPDPPAT